MKRDRHRVPRQPAGRTRFPLAVVLTVLTIAFPFAGPGCGSHAAPEPTASQSAALTPTGTRDVTITTPNVATFTYGVYAYGGPGGCTPVTPVTSTLTVSPVNRTGTVTLTAQNFTISRCPGVTFPGQAAYFTWSTPTVLPSSGTDKFQVEFSVSGVGSAVIDVNVSEGTSGKSQGKPSALPCSACDAEGGTVSEPAATDDVPLFASDASTVGQVAVGAPIDLGSGNVFYEHTDYTTAGQNPLAFTRSYNSGASTNAFAVSFAGTTSPSRSWRHNYDRFIDILDATSVVAERPDGKMLNFDLVGSTWTPDTDVDYTLTQSGSTWTLTGPDDTVETYTTTGAGTSAALDTIARRNGYTQTMAYTSGLLTSVTDSYSRTLTLTYNSNGTLNTVATPDSTTITYGYTTISGGPALSTVSFPTSPTQTLTYVYGNSSLPFALTSVTDENGNTYQTWTYDSAGHGLTSAQGGSLNANLVTITYPTLGTTTTVTNALGVTDTYTFTTLQNVPKLTGIVRTATSTTAAATESFGYDSNGYINSRTDWNGNQTSWTNNGHGLPTSITEAVGTSVARTVSIAYDTTWPRLPATITSAGVTRTITYDSLGEVLTNTLTDTTTTSTPYSTGGQTRTTTNTWSNHLLATTKTPNGDTTSFGYNSAGALTSITNALSQVTSITAVTGGGRPLTIVDPNGVTTTLTYDPRQRLLTSAVTMSAGVRTTSYSYDAAGNLTQTTLPDGSYLANTYDTAHRLTKVTDALGNYRTFTLDALGDRTATDTYTSYPVLYAQHGDTFDALGRLLVDTGGRGQTTTFTHDNNGNVLTIQDGNSHTTTRTIDALNRVAASTDANSGTVTPTYDAHDRITAIQDALGHSTSFVIDGFGDVIQQASPDTGTTVYHFDSDGNLTSKTDALGVVTNQTWDALDRILTRSYPADSTQNVTFTYDNTGWPYGDGIGRLTGVAGPSGNYEFFGYDERGETSFKRTVVSGTNYDIWPVYDAAGRYNGVAYPSGMWGGIVARNAAGQPNEVAEFPTGSGSYSVVAWTGVEPFGPVDYVYYGNNIGGPVQRDRDYNISNITMTNSSSTVLQNLSYTFDGANNVTGITDAVNASNSQTFVPDVINRITSATSGSGGYGSLSWAYDKNGNLTSSVAGGTTTTYGLTSGTNQIASITVGMGSPVTVSTNADGNITSIPPPIGGSAATLSYNVAGKLASVSGGSTTPASYTYSFDGRRVTKTVGGVTTIYLTGVNGELLEERTGSSVLDYLYEDGTLLGLYQPASTTLYYVHPDALGTPQFITDASENIVWSTTYQPYGTTGTITSTGAVTNNVRLPGQYFDAEDGLHQNWNRDYMPNLGRYAEADRFGLRGGLNPYAYANENPLQFIDPTGLASWNLFPNGSAEQNDATNYNPPGVFSIAGHGVPYGIYDANQAGLFGGQVLLGNSFLSQLYANGYVAGSGVPIVLLSCRTGQGQFAQWVATQTGADVTAPTNEVLIGTSNGVPWNYVLGNGQFVTYHPNGSTPTPVGNSYPATATPQ